MKKLIALLLAVVMVLGLAACATKAETPATDTPATDTPAASTETETKTETKEETPAEETDAEFNPADYTLVISMPVVNHPVHRCVQLGFVEACKELGYNYQIVGTETGDDNEVIAAAEAAAASGAAGIIIWGQNETYLPCIATLKNDYNVLTCVPHFAWDQDQAVGLDVNLACDAATYAVSVADYMAEQLEGKTGGNVAAAKIVGARLAEKAKAAGIESCAFDRSGYRYHGRVAALAEAAREAGLKF